MELHLNYDIFEIVKNGTKHIEIRLYDEKRRKLKIGDKLTFVRKPNNDKVINAIVRDLKVYKDFNELVKNYDIKDIYLENYSKEDFLKLLEQFYSKEEQEKYGALAIEFEKYEKSCGIVVFDDKDKVLMVQHNKGHWGMPKGHVEENETEFETAIRETLEETNIKASIIDGFREVVTYSPKINTIKDVVFFVGTANNFNIIKQDSEVSEVRFMDIKEAISKLTEYQDIKKVLEKAYKFYKGE